MSSGIAGRVVASAQKRNGPTDASKILTVHEKEIPDYLSKDFLYKKIATELFISKEIIEKHIHIICEKF